MRLAEYIIGELGDGVYDELGIDRKDYSGKPAAEFYGEIVRACRELRPDIVDRWERREEAGFRPKTDRTDPPADFPSAVRIARDIAAYPSSYRLSRVDASSVRDFAEAILNVSRDRTPAEVGEFLDSDPSGTVPNSTINRRRLKNYIAYIARRYRGQYAERRRRGRG